MPLLKMDFMSSVLALAEPVPFTVAILMVKSLILSVVTLGHPSAAQNSPWPERRDKIAGSDFGRRMPARRARRRDEGEQYIPVGWRIAILAISFWPRAILRCALSHGLQLRSRQVCWLGGDAGSNSCDLGLAGL